MGESTLGPGELFHERYEVVRLLGAGGIGEVYEVVHRYTRRRCALKTLRTSAATDQWMKDRFIQEAYVTADVQSDHIVQVLDAGVDAARKMPFLVMELLDGEDLERRMARMGPLPPATVAYLLEQAAYALEKTHGRGIVHRDLKPANLFVARGEQGERVKILDFGIAKIQEQEKSRVQTSTRAIGTPMFMPPEQIMGEVTIGPPADLYALAHIAYALLSGQPYWEGEAHNTDYVFMTYILAGAKEPASVRAFRRGVSLPPAFDAWFFRATSPDPQQRHPSATAMIAEMRAALTPGPITDVVAVQGLAMQPPAQAAPPRRSGGGAVAVLLLLAVAGAIGAVVWMKRVHAPGPTAQAGDGTTSTPTPTSTSTSTSTSTPSATSTSTSTSTPSATATAVASEAPSASQASSADAAPSAAAKQKKRPQFPSKKGSNPLDTRW